MIEIFVVLPAEDPASEGKKLVVDQRAKFGPFKRKVLKPLVPGLEEDAFQVRAPRERETLLHRLVPSGRETDLVYRLQVHRMRNDSLYEVTRTTDSLDDNYIYSGTKLCLKKGQAAKAGETVCLTFLFQPKEKEPMKELLAFPVREKDTGREFKAAFLAKFEEMKKEDSFKFRDLQLSADR